MPLYDFKCLSCGHTDIEVRPMSAPNRDQCPVCAKRAYSKQVSLPHTDLHEFHTPIEMFSIAMDDTDEIRRFKARCPDVDISDDPRNDNYGLPIARSRKAKMQALAAANCSEK